MQTLAHPERHGEREHRDHHPPATGQRGRAEFQPRRPPRLHPANLRDHPPGESQQDQHQRHREKHPFEKPERHPRALQIAQRDRVGRRCDRRAQPADIGRERHRQQQRFPRPVALRQPGDQRHDEGQHKRGRGRVAHPHGKQGRDTEHPREQGGVRAHERPQQPRPPSPPPAPSRNRRKTTPVRGPSPR